MTNDTVQDKLNLINALAGFDKIEAAIPRRDPLAFFEFGIISSAVSQARREFLEKYSVQVAAIIREMGVAYAEKLVRAEGSTGSPVGPG